MARESCLCGATDCPSCGPAQGYHACEHGHFPDQCPYRDCENCADFEPPIICVECDDPARVRCTECGEWYCCPCFGPAENAEVKNPVCGLCAVELAKQGIY